MYINNLSLNNFKSHVQSDIEFSKITILTGANSSGKSSILYSILGALQSYRFPFYYSPNGDYVNMGSFRDIFYKHKANGIFDINISLKNKASEEFIYNAKYVENKTSKLPKLEELTLRSDFFKFTLKKNTTFKGKYFYKGENDSGFDLPETFVNKFTELMNELGKGIPANRKSGPTPEELIYRLKNPKVRGTISFRTFDQLFTKLDKWENYELSKSLKEFVGNFSTLDANHNYISSFREPPERIYYQRSISTPKVKKFGENYIEQILDWEEKSVKQYNELNYLLKRLKLLEGIKTKRLRGGRFEVLVKTSPKSVESNLSDVGFGVSQFLPIIVADLQLQKNSTLIISQPEIHLHPSIQSSLGDYFIENMLKNKKRYIIETHSEYLINKFRLLIANGKLKEDDIKIYFLDNKEKCKIENIRFLKDGTIKGAPKEFFDTYMIDVMNIALAAE